jgi:hypothetical protein
MFSAQAIESQFTSTTDLGNWPQAKLHTQWPGGTELNDPSVLALSATQAVEIEDFHTQQELNRDALVALIDKIGIDDPVGAWSVHGTCGIWGTLAVGLFNTDKGLLTGHGFGQLGLQFIGVISYSLFAAITAWIVWSVLGALSGGIRVTEQEEVEGLDIGEHGMEAYPDFVSSSS